MFWWNWFPGFEKNTSFELSRTNILCDETDETKNLQIQKILTFSGMSDHPSIDYCNLNVTTRSSGSWRSPIVNQKTLIDLGSHSPGAKFYSLRHQLLELDFSEINIFRCSLCFDLFTESLQCSGCETLRPSKNAIVYEVLKWHTTTLRMLCATSQCVSVPLRNQITYLEIQV